MKKSPVGIGIVGTGFARTTQIPGFRDCMGAKVVAIASRTRERAEATAKEFGIEHVLADWQDLVAHNDVDRRDALAAGYQMHIAKPIGASQLVTMVARLAGRDT